MSTATPSDGRTFGELLHEFLAQRDISVRELARRTNFNHGYISRVLRGRQNPSADLAKHLDAALDAEGTLVAAAVHDPPALPDIEDDAGELVEAMRRIDASDLGPATLEVLNGAVEQLCRDYPTMPGARLRDRSRRLLRQTLSMLDRRTTLAQHRELLVIAGWLAALLGCVHFDVGDRVSAETARRLAYQLGDQSGHGEVVGWSYELAAWFALTDGRYPEVVAAAQAGRERAGISSAGVQLALQEAKALARMGDERAHTMAQNAEEMLHHVPVPDNPSHHFKFDPSKLESHVATLYTWLEWNDVAADYAHVVADRYQQPNGEHRPMRLANVRVNLGILAGRRGDLDEAVHLGGAAFDFDRRSGALTAWAYGLLTELRQRYPGETLVSSYHDRLSAEQHR